MRKMSVAKGKIVKLPDQKSHDLSCITQKIFQKNPHVTLKELLKIEATIIHLKKIQALVNGMKNVPLSQIELKCEFVPYFVSFDNMAELRDVDDDVSQPETGDSGIASSPDLEPIKEEEDSRPLTPPRFLVLREDSYYVDMFWEPPKLSLGEKYLVPFTFSRAKIWTEAELVKIVGLNLELRILKNGTISKFDLKSIALLEPTRSLLREGARVVAPFKSINSCSLRSRSCKQLGVVGEYPNESNKSRYLIIFDNGCFRYIQPSEVHPIIYNFECVWREVVSVATQKKIQDFFNNLYCNMREFREGQVFTFGEDCHLCQIREIDASLVQVWNETTRQIQWIHRGSPLIRKIIN